MVKKAAAKPEPEVLEAPSPDLAPVESDGQIVTSFIAGVVQFFREAMALEASAREYRGAAEVLHKPTNADEDSEIQTFIKKGTSGIKEIEAHYDPIASAFHNIHRRITSARGRSVKFREDGKAIAQRLHNEYAEEERRKAFAEQERLRREEEARQKAARDAEAKRLEEEALAREAASPELSEREDRFTEYVASDVYMPARAAQLAGYANPEVMASRLMAMPKIIQAIDAKREAKRLREQAAARRDQPISTASVPAIKPNLGKAAGGSFDRTFHSAELLNAGALIAAVIAGGHGIPHDVLTVNEAKLNEYARSLQERINAWPGVRYKKETKTI